MLAVTGMRFGEALRLDRGDIDHEHDLLVVRDSKFGKSRELALHPSTITVLTYCTAHLAFKRIVDDAGLQPRSAGSGALARKQQRQGR